MKLLWNQIETNAKTKLTFALCTVLALSAAPLGAQEDNYRKDKNQDKGAPGEVSTSEAGKAGKLSRADEKFIKDACQGGHIEVKMANLGVQKAQNSEVRQFAQKLVDDHTKANSELKELAARKGCTLPEPQDRITSIGEDVDRTRVREKAGAEQAESKEHAEFQAEWNKLESSSGADFDRQYVHMTVKCHEQMTKGFEKASQKSDDADVMAFAAKRLPTLREHLTAARSLQSQVGNIGAPGAESGTEIDRSNNPEQKSDKK